MNRMTILVGAAALVLAGGARAEVVDSQDNGFEVSQKAAIAAPAERVWTALSQIGAWWSPVHTYSHDSANLSIALKPGGCYCEALPGGGVQHLTVIFVRPHDLVRLEGALGPMQAAGIAGHLTWTLSEAGGLTTFTQTYDAGGYYKGGLKSLAPVVDRVLGEQLTRLKSYVETGKAK